MDAEKIGQFILEQRKKMKLTQAELAEKIHVTSQAVSKWENGKGIPDLEFIKSLSECFGVDMKDIIDGEKNKRFYKNRKAWLFCIVFLFALFLGIWWLFPSQDTNFQFSSLASKHEDFALKGVVAYNQNKKSLYISDVTYLSNNDEKYYGVTCTLFEEVGDTSKKIGECKTDLKDQETYTISELLKNIEFRLDDYSCSCQSTKCNQMFLDIKLLNLQNQYVSYDIPLEILQSCDTQRTV